jgi:hypothetical protein
MKIFDRSLIKLIICLLFSVGILFKNTDFLHCGISYTTNLKVKIDSLNKFNEVYLLPSKIESLFLFHEASGGLLCSKKTIQSLDTFIFLKKIHPELLRLKVNNKNKTLSTYKMIYNKRMGFYEIKETSDISFYISKYLFYHSLRLLFSCITLLVVLVIMDYIMFHDNKKLFQIGVVISVIFSITSMAIVYNVLFKAFLAYFLT